MDIIRAALNLSPPRFLRRRAALGGEVPRGQAYEVHHYGKLVPNIFSFIREKLGPARLAEMDEVDSAIETFICTMPIKEQPTAREALQTGLSIDHSAPDRLRVVYTYVRNHFNEVSLVSSVERKINAVITCL